MSLLISQVVHVQSTDSATVGLSLTADALEGREILDTETELLVLTASSSDQAAYVEAQTETFALTPSATDVAADIDSAGVYLYLDIPFESFNDDFDDGVIDPYWINTFTFNTESGGVFHIGSESNARIRPAGSSLASSSQSFDSVALKLASLAVSSDFRIELFAQSFKDDLTLFSANGAALEVRETAGTKTLLAFIWDDSNNVISSVATFTGFSLPLWLRFRRTYPGLVLEYSTNGTSWTSYATTASDYRWMRRVVPIMQRIGSGGSGDQATIDNYVFTGTQVEVAQFVDTPVVPLALTPSASEVAVFADSKTESLLLTSSSNDVVAYVDSAVEPLKLSPSTTDVAITIDSETGIVLISPSAGDTTQYSDIQIDVLALNPVSSDLAAFQDIQTDYLALTPDTSDIEGSVDIGREDLLLTAEGTENVVTTDQDTEILAFVPSSTDAASYNDGSAEKVTLTPISGNTLGTDYADSGTESFTTLPSGSDVQFAVDSETEALSLSVSAASVATYSDSAGANVILAPDGTDVIEHIDQEVGILHITPVGFGRELLDSALVLLTLTPGVFEIQRVVELTGRLYRRLRVSAMTAFSGSLSFRRWRGREGNV